MRRRLLRSGFALGVAVCCGMVGRAAAAEAGGAALLEPAEAIDLELHWPTGPDRRATIRHRLPGVLRFPEQDRTAAVRRGPVLSWRHRIDDLEVGVRGDLGRKTAADDERWEFLTLLETGSLRLHMGVEGIVPDLDPPLGDRRSLIERAIEQYRVGLAHRVPLLPRVRVAAIGAFDVAPTTAERGWFTALRLAFALN